jgi:hypothetical protein
MASNNEREPTFERTLSIWWLLAWRGTICGALMGELLGAVIGVVWYALHGSPQNLQMVSSIAGSLIGLTWGFVVLRMALRKNYSGFRIALVPVAAPA